MKKKSTLEIMDANNREFLLIEFLIEFLIKLMINSNRKCSILSVPARAKDCYFIRKGLACSDHKQAEPHPAVGRSVRFRLQNVNTLRSIISYRYVQYRYHTSRHGTIPYSSHTRIFALSSSC